MASRTVLPLPSRLTGIRQVPLVGRRQERETLERTWGLAKEGKRQAVFIGGEPGVGKTRLAGEAALIAHEEGAGVLFGASAPDPGVPYRPFAEILDHLFADSPGGTPDHIVEQVGHHLSHLSKHMRDQVGPAPPRTTTRQELYEAVATALREAARRFPLVLLLDDLHWAQINTLGLLAHVVEASHDVPMLVVGTFRTTAPDSSDDLASRLADLHRLEGIRRLDLGGLDTEAIADYLVEYGGLPTATARPTAAILRAKTGGNPFFLKEVWNDVGRRSRVSGADVIDAVPSSVRVTLEARLSRLGGSTRETLQLAAVVGEEFEIATLVSAQGGEVGPVLSAIDAATAAGLIHPQPNRDGVYEFVHSLARQAVLSGLPPSAQIELHARVAAVLAGQALHPELIPRLADHYLNAQTLGLEAEAIHYAGEAGRISEESLAYEEAAAWFGRAAGVPSASAEQRAALLLSAASNHLRAGDFARARETYAALTTDEDPGARLRAAMGYEEANWRPGRADPRAAELLSNALEAYRPSADDVRSAQALASLGRALAFTGAIQEARRVGDRALELARRLDDEASVAHALEASLWHGLAPQGVAVELSRSIELAEIARRRNDYEALGVASHFRAVAAYMLGDAEQLEIAASGSRQAAAALNQPFFDYVMQCVAQGRALLRGDFVGAERWARATVETGRAFGADTTEGSHGVQMFLLRRETGQLEEFRAHFDGSESFDGRWVAGMLAMYTELRLGQGARRALTYLLKRDLEVVVVEAQWPMELVFMAEGALFLGDAEAAGVLLPHLERYEGSNLVGGQFVAPLGSADSYLARLSALLGRHEAAERYFQEAECIDESIGSVIHSAETRAHHALFAARRGNDRRAAELASDARRLAELIGQRRTLRLLDGLAGDEAADGLTGREVDVLRLVAKGLSNREIAERLYISTNTAANHVRSIFTKTGVSNRTQAAIYAARHGLVQSDLREGTIRRDAFGDLDDHVGG